MASSPRSPIRVGLLSAAGRLCRAAVDFVYPPVCPLCGGEADGAEAGGGGICATCAGALVRDDAARCARCAAPVGPHLDTVNGCIHCGRDRFAFESVIRLGVYDGLLRTACMRAKHTGGRGLAAGLAELLGEREGAALRAADAACVVPVPHHWTDRLRGRPNAAETVALVLARRLRVEFAGSILCKTRRTPAQASLTPAQRRTNLRRAFRARGRIPAGITVLLVDDILTTGTTAHEAARHLRSAGAERVLVAVLARGLGRD